MKMNVVKKTDIMLELVEQINEYKESKGALAGGFTTRLLEDKITEFKEIFASIPYDEQRAFVALLATTDTINMTDAQELMKMADQQERIRNIAAQFTLAATSLTPSNYELTASTTTSIVWDSYQEMNKENKQ